MNVVDFKPRVDVIAAARELLEKCESGEVLAFVTCAERKDDYEMIVSAPGEKERICMTSVLFTWSCNKVKMRFKDG